VRKDGCCCGVSVSAGQRNRGKDERGDPRSGQRSGWSCAGSRQHCAAYRWPGVTEVTNL
jgi:hypothetical protein